jgi:hypothetical protein
VAYLPNYTHDIFVSYAHDPEPFVAYRGGMRTDFLSKWTHSFIDNLSGYVDILLGTKDQKRRVSAWMDPDLDGNCWLSEGLHAKIKESALLLVVMSPFYLESIWCGEELRWFADATGSTRSNRIFAVKAFNTPIDKWPATLKPDGHPVSGYTFYTTEDPNDLGKPLGWPLPDERDKAYWDQLWKLANEIAAQLKRMEWAAGRTTSVSEVSAKKAERIPGHVGRTLCPRLYMHDSLTELRADLRTRLDRSGFKVVPPIEDDPVDEQTVRSSFEKYLPASDGVALIANQNSELWPKGQSGGPLGLQLQLGQQYSRPAHLWLQATDLNLVRNPQYRSFLANIEANARGRPDIAIHAQDIDEFIGYIGAKLDVAPKAPKEAEQLAVVCSNIRSDQPRYKAFQDIVTSALKEADRSLITDDPADPAGQIRLTELEDELSRADTVVVLCFDQEWNWANKIILQLRQIMGEQTKKTKIFVTGPEYRKKGKFEPAFRFKTVVGVTPDNRVAADEVTKQIKSFLSAPHRRNGSDAGNSRRPCCPESPLASFTFSRPASFQDHAVGRRIADLLWPQPRKGRNPCAFEHQSPGFPRWPLRVRQIVTDKGGRHPCSGSRPAQGARGELASRRDAPGRPAGGQFGWRARRFLERKRNPRRVAKAGL